MVWRWLCEVGYDRDSDQNMIIDQQVLDSFVAGECLPTVRVYRWPQKCVTIGRNQSLEEARGAYPTLDVHRRPTGGRAVSHGDDLTVTVVAGEKALRDDWDKCGILATYYRILEGIQSTIATYGVETGSGRQSRDRQAVDCFASSSKCDLLDLASGSKIVGSALYRSRSAVMQQMSLRQHERYHIFDRDFIMRLQDGMARSLAVTEWQQATDVSAFVMFREQLTHG